MKDIGARIRARRKRLGWTVQLLADRAGIDGGFLSKIERGAAFGSWETYEKVSGALGVSLNSLIVSGNSNVEPAPIGWRRIPVLSYREAARWTAKSSMGQKGGETIMTELERPPSAFALRLVGQTMTPQFRDGDVVVIDPTMAEPAPGDFVVATDGRGEAIFRQYRELGRDKDGRMVFELAPLNRVHAAVRSDREELAIVGTMVELRSYRRPPNTEKRGAPEPRGNEP